MATTTRPFGTNDPSLPLSAEEAAACPHLNLDSRYAVDGQMQQASNGLIGRRVYT